ncbi:MAG: hypothetical protein ABGY96_19590 [bacterium]|nr:hypothetical protein [Gammaproteobacteria bacterium]HIL98515.1 hypothetical protein [Pseudomonadales bacterium]
MATKKDIVQQISKEFLGKGRLKSKDKKEIENLLSADELKQLKKILGKVKGYLEDDKGLIDVTML